MNVSILLMRDNDWSDDEDDWLETGAEDELGGPDAAVPCPECGAAIYDDLDHCPRCGYWIIDADRALDGGRFPSRRVRMVTLLVLIVFVIALLAGSGAFF